MLKTSRRTSVATHELSERYNEVPQQDTEAADPTETPTPDEPVSAEMREQRAIAATGATQRQIAALRERVESAEVEQQALTTALDAAHQRHAAAMAALVPLPEQIAGARAALMVAVGLPTEAAAQRDLAERLAEQERLTQEEVAARQALEEAQKRAPQEQAHLAEKIAADRQALSDLEQLLPHLERQRLDAWRQQGRERLAETAAEIAQLRRQADEARAQAASAQAALDAANSTIIQRMGDFARDSEISREVLSLLPAQDRPDTSALEHALRAELAASRAWEANAGHLESLAPGGVPLHQLWTSMINPALVAQSLEGNGAFFRQRIQMVEAMLGQIPHITGHR